MSTSTDGQICFGILFEEGYEFPWDAKPWDGYDEDWWLNENGYKPPFRLYDDQGRYLNGIKPFKDKLHEYYAHQHAFQKEHPFPVKLINVCHIDYPIYILAVPSSCKTASRGFPETFAPSDLKVSPEEVQALTSFCEKYGIEAESEPQWYLSSYCG